MKKMHPYRVIVWGGFGQNAHESILQFFVLKL